MNTLKNLSVTTGKANGTAATENPTPDVKIIPISTSSKKEPEKLPPLDDRLLRLNQLFEIQGKYNRLQSSLQKLKTFTFKKDGDYTGITIRDDGRNDFTTSNPDVIREIVKFLMITIQEKIKAIEPQLKW